MNAEGPRGNAGRGIESTGYYASTAVSNPLSSGDQEAQCRRTLRAYRCAAVKRVPRIARFAMPVPAEVA